MTPPICCFKSASLLRHVTRHSKPLRAHLCVSISKASKFCQGEENEKSKPRTLSKAASKDLHNVYPPLINLSGEKESDFLSGPPTISSAANAPTAELVVTP